MNGDAVQYIYSNNYDLAESSGNSVHYVYTYLGTLVPEEFKQYVYIAGKVPGGTVDALGLH